RMARSRASRAGARPSWKPVAAWAPARDGFAGRLPSGFMAGSELRCACLPIRHALTRWRRVPMAKRVCRPGETCDAERPMQLSHRNYYQISVLDREPTDDVPSTLEQVRKTLDRRVASLD